MNIKTLLGYFRSRTVWTLIVLFVVNGLEGVRELVTPAQLMIVDAILMILGIYFRVRPRQTFNKNDPKENNNLSTV